MIYQGRTLRHELKYYINEGEYTALRQRLRAVMLPDTNMTKEEGYLISSVYFDDVTGSAYKEKASGVRFRKKYRVRLYEHSDSLIRLECKQKSDEFISKISAPLTRAEYDSLMQNDFDFLFDRPEPVCKEVLALNRARLLRPLVTVEYLREAYVNFAGNVRITFDKNISASLRNVDVFDPGYGAFRVLPPGIMVLEVKFDDFLPDHIHKMILPVMGNRSAVSKYVLCRDYKRKADSV